jgi:hypothetical protein
MAMIKRIHEKRTMCLIAFVNASMVNTSIASSLRPTLVVIDANESQKVGEEL